jgi:hypothetical protein
MTKCVSDVPYNLKYKIYTLLLQNSSVSKCNFTAIDDYFLYRNLSNRKSHVDIIRYQLWDTHDTHLHSLSVSNDTVGG